MKTSGNIYVMLFGAAVMAGVVGMSAQKYVMNPLKTASNVTRKNAAETQLQLGLRVAATNAVTQQGSSGDCDSDGMVEPMPYVDAGAGPHPAGGGYLPTTVGGIQIDPWNTRYGYCVWDHGSAVDAAGCGGAPQLRLPGTNGEEWESMAVISAGPDKVFQTTCNAWADANVDNIPDTPLLNRPNGSDDVYYAWSYQEADVSSGLWTAVGATGAQISKNLSVKDGTNSEQLSFDSTTAALALGPSGRARIPTVSTDYIQSLTSPSVLLQHGLSFFPEDGTGASYYLQNPTGDNFVMSPNTSMRQVFNTSEIAMYPNTTSSRKVTFAYAASSMRLNIRGDSTEYHSGIELESTYTGAPVTLNKQMYIAAKHQAADGNNDYTSRIVFGQAVSGGATPTSSDLSGYLSFQTRPAGLALNGTLNEMMRIHPTGNVTMGSVHTANANKLKTNIGLHATNGNIGIGTTTPATALDVNGNMILGSNGGACNAARAPLVRYNPSYKCLEYCFTDGVWKCANFTACGTTLPAAFTLATSGVAGNVYTSTIHQVTGIGTCNAMASVSGLGAPQLQVCSDAACSTVVQTWTNTPYTIQDGQYIQVRNTIPQSGVTFKTSLTIGSRTYEWNNTTAGDCAAPSPPAGTFCADGTIYVGLSPDGNTKMYTTPCAFGRVWDPQTFTCQGVLQLVPWSNNNTIITGINNDTTGEANTTALAALANADAPYYPAQICNNMTAHGYSDWYLPTTTEAIVIIATCSVHPEGGCSSGNYFWGSREHSSLPATNARRFSFNGVNNNGTAKTTTSPVLCVRKD